MRKKQKDEMPEYVCHKRVRALQIAQVFNHVDGSARLTTLDGGQKYIDVNEEFMAKHDPQESGYFVVYSDGYESYSPRLAFEGGYALAQKNQGDEIVERFKGDHFVLCDEGDKIELIKSQGKIFTQTFKDGKLDESYAHVDAKLALRITQMLLGLNA